MSAQDFVGRLTHGVAAFLGDAVLMRAAVAAAAGVIAADDAVEAGEVVAALDAVRAEPTLEAGYRAQTLEAELSQGLARARTRAGREENERCVAAVRGRPVEQRNAVFLIAADAAGHAGISPPERAALDALAAALIVDEATLLQASQARRFVSGAP